MTASEKNTLFYIGVFGVLAYVGWKLWPALRKSLNSGATGGGSSAGATNAAPYSPYESPYGSSSQSPLSAGLSFGGGGGSGSTAGYGATNGDPGRRLSTICLRMASMRPTSLQRTATTR